VLYGEDEEERLPEIRAIARWLAHWARDINIWDHNLIVLGDFNIDRGDPLHGAFVSTGMDIPDDLQDAPRTLFSDPGKPELNKFYDQIAWFTGRNGLPSSLAAILTRGLFRFHGCRVGVAGVDEGGALLADLRPLRAVGGVLHA
jgi:hypothetical protein